MQELKLRVLFPLLFLVFGLIYMWTERNSLDRKKFAVGLLLVSFGCAEGVCLLEACLYSPIAKKVLSAVEIIIPIGALCYVAVLVKSWRSYLIGFLLFLITAIVFAYFYSIGVYAH